MEILKYKYIKFSKCTSTTALYSLYGQDGVAHIETGSTDISIREATAGEDFARV